MIVCNDFDEEQPAVLMKTGLSHRGGDGEDDTDRKKAD